MLDGAARHDAGAGIGVRPLVRMLAKGDNRAIREVNRSIVVDLVRRGGRISRTELARRSKLTKPTVSTIIFELIDEGVVREVRFGESVSGGGRPARLLEFNDARSAYLGIDFGVRATTVAVADARGPIRLIRSRPSVHGQSSQNHAFHPAAGGGTRSR